MLAYRRVHTIGKASRGGFPFCVESAGVRLLWARSAHEWLDEEREPSPHPCAGRLSAGPACATRSVQQNPRASEDDGPRRSGSAVAVIGLRETDINASRYAMVGKC